MGFFQRLFDICLLRAGPQDLPDSQALLRLALLGYVIAGWYLLGVVAESPTAVPHLVADLGLGVGLLYGLLYWRGFLNRFRQTATAFFGCGALFTLLAALLTTGVEPGEPPAPMAGLLLILLLPWSVAVDGHILRHALDMPLPQALAIAMLYMVVSWNIGLVFA